jgi:SAM-dependent methyltransferase
LAKSEQMGFYSRYVVPRLTHVSMGQPQLQHYRSRVINGAIGRVLAIGFGSGRNIPYYSAAVGEVVGVDVSPEMLALAAPAVAGSPCRVTLLARSAESLPFADRAFDTVVTTWSLGSIPDPAVALRGARRVLKCQGQLRFVEQVSHQTPAFPNVVTSIARSTIWCARPASRAPNFQRATHARGPVEARPDNGVHNAHDLLIPRAILLIFLLVVVRLGTRDQ